MNEGGGRAVGSRIRLFGGSLSLEEVIIQREPLHDKTWRTTGPPDFLILGEYQFSTQHRTGQGLLQIDDCHGLRPTRR